MAALRASDADREAVAERLRVAAGEGRLDHTELEERLEAALSARTYAELDWLVEDLPGPGLAPRPRGRIALPRVVPVPIAVIAMTAVAVAAVAIVAAVAVTWWMILAVVWLVRRAHCGTRPHTLHPAR